MASKAPRDDVGDEHLSVKHPMSSAAGVGGISHGLGAALHQMGVRRSALTLLAVNQNGGFDCPGCAWPEPGHRHTAEFCENGAKAVAEEATLRRVGPEFFAAHPISELATRSGHWLGQQGRLTEPVVRRAGSDRYEPIGWDEAFALIADRLHGLASPDEAVFYTSGRTSNEAAFCYQLFARAYGTNNMPDCSNMCHESSGTALTETIGIGKGSVTLDDIHQADLLVIVGQNPGTNHPRMLTALEIAKRNGATIIAINPLPEAGLMNFRNPQRPNGIVGHGTPLADLFLQVKLGGDLALFAAFGHLLLSRPDVLDRDFIDSYTEGFEEYAQARDKLDWEQVTGATGLTRAEIEAAAELLAGADRTIVCWAMGLTQHRESVPTIREITDVQLLRGMIGKPGAGLCPVRGHSNVQGDRTMGIWEKLPKWAPKLADEFGIDVPPHTGYDTVGAIRAMRDGKVGVFVGLGGNFAAATPDTALTERALAGCGLTVQISTKLNRSHAVPGETALILPTLGRTEVDVRAGEPQRVTVEDSMSCVHASQGRLAPASPELRSEVAIVTGLARAVLGDDLPWREFADDYRSIRSRIARIIPGFADYEQRIDEPGGFTLPHPPRDTRAFPTPSGKARFTANEIVAPQIPAGRLLLQTVRSHDQYNTTIYGRDDRYRGIHNGRRVVFVHRDDLTTLGIADGAMVDLVSEWPDDADRRAPGFRVVAYPTARGCAAAYFPETNVLVPLDSTAKGSNTPTSKSIVIRLEPAA
jgi:molybdopterin-dependent oxidoreductase alpha subunit